MATPSVASIQRLKKEYQSILKERPPFIQAHPHKDNLLTWHYAIEGPPGSVYEGGIYHGKVSFPVEYPFKPPAITMITPSGRFEPNKPLCLTMSNYHPENWNPLWSVSSILNGLLSFMLENTPTAGSITSTESEKRELASASHFFNKKNADFKRYFPDLVRDPDFRNLKQSGGGTNSPANVIGKKEIDSTTTTPVTTPKLKTEIDNTNNNENKNEVKNKSVEIETKQKNNIEIQNQQQKQQLHSIFNSWKSIGALMTFLVLFLSWWFSRN